MLWPVLAMTALALAAQGTAVTEPAAWAAPDEAKTETARNNEAINERLNMGFLLREGLRAAGHQCTCGAAAQSARSGDRAARERLVSSGRPSQGGCLCPPRGGAGRHRSPHGHFAPGTNTTLPPLLMVVELPTTDPVTV